MYKIGRKVHLSMCDMTSRLSVEAIGQIVEDSVTEMLTEIGLGAAVMKSRYDAAWIVVTSRTEYTRRPDWFENMQIECRITNMTGARVFADTVIRDDYGALCAWNRCELCAMSLEKRTPVRVRPIMEAAGITAEQAVMDMTYSYPRAEIYEKITSCRVESSNIDYLGHVNNVEYMRFAQSAYSAAQIKKAEIAALEIGYHRQGYEGEMLDVGLKREGDRDLISVSRGDELLTQFEIVYREA